MIWVKQLLVKIKDDFDLKKIYESGQCFRWFPLEDGGYVILSGNHILTISLSHVGDSLFADPDGKSECMGEIIEQERSVYYEVECSPEEWKLYWADYFDLSVNYSNIRKRIDPEADSYLFAASEAGQGIRILKQDPWETLITFIISQRKNIPAIRTCIEKLCSVAGEEITDQKRGAHYYTFPNPAGLVDLSEDELKSCGLGYRTSYIKETARLAAKGEINFHYLQSLRDEELLYELMKLPGVGAKVAGCVMLFGLHRLNAFPKDVWINKVFQEHYPEGFPFERYSPYCGLMQQYLFWYRRKK